MIPEDKRSPIPSAMNADVDPDISHERRAVESRAVVQQQVQCLNVQDIILLDSDSDDEPPSKRPVQDSASWHDSRHMQRSRIQMSEHPSEHKDMSTGPTRHATRRLFHTNVDLGTRGIPVDCSIQTTSKKIPCQSNNVTRTVQTPTWSFESRGQGESSDSEADAVTERNTDRQLATSSRKRTRNEAGTEHVTLSCEDRLKRIKSDEERIRRDQEAKNVAKSQAERERKRQAKVAHSYERGSTSTIFRKSSEQAPDSEEDWGLRDEALGVKRPSESSNDSNAVANPYARETADLYRSQNRHLEKEYMLHRSIPTAKSQPVEPYAQSQAEAALRAEARLMRMKQQQPSFKESKLGGKRLMRRSTPPIPRQSPLRTFLMPDTESSRKIAKHAKSAKNRLQFHLNQSTDLERSEQPLIQRPNFDSLYPHKDNFDIFEHKLPKHFATLPPDHQDAVRTKIVLDSHVADLVMIRDLQERFVLVLVSFTELTDKQGVQLQEFREYAEAVLEHERSGKIQRGRMLEIKANLYRNLTKKGIATRGVDVSSQFADDVLTAEHGQLLKDKHLHAIENLRVAEAVYRGFNQHRKNTRKTPKKHDERTRSDIHLRKDSQARSHVDALTRKLQEYNEDREGRALEKQTSLDDVSLNEDGLDDEGLTSEEDEGEAFVSGMRRQGVSEAQASEFLRPDEDRSERIAQMPSIALLEDMKRRKAVGPDASTLRQLVPRPDDTNDNSESDGVYHRTASRSMTATGFDDIDGCVDNELFSEITDGAPRLCWKYLIKICTRGLGPEFDDYDISGGEYLSRGNAEDGMKRLKLWFTEQFAARHPGKANIRGRLTIEDSDSEYVLRFSVDEETDFGYRAWIEKDLCNLSERAFDNAKLQWACKNKNVWFVNHETRLTPYCHDEGGGGEKSAVVRAVEDTESTGWDDTQTRTPQPPTQAITDREETYQSTNTPTDSANHTSSDRADSLFGSDDDTVPSPASTFSPIPKSAEATSEVVLPASRTGIRVYTNIACANRAAQRGFLEWYKGHLRGPTSADYLKSEIDDMEEQLKSIGDLDCWEREESFDVVKDGIKLTETFHVWVEQTDLCGPKN